MRRVSADLTNAANGGRKNKIPWQLFGLAAILLGLAAVVGAVGYRISVSRSR